MERIYHHYEKWEDYKHGFYDSLSGKNKNVLMDKVVELFSSQELTDKYMRMVIEQWPYSCEHNLSNPSLNRVAYLGQSACCIYGGIPSGITMSAWSLVSQKNRDEADKIASKIIKEWELKQINYAEN